MEVSAVLPPDEEELEDAFISPDPFDVLAEIDDLSGWGGLVESSYRE